MVSPDGLTRAVRCETMHRIYTLPVVEFGWIAVHDARARRGPLSCIFDSQPSPGPTVALRCAVLGCSCLCTRQAGRTRWEVRSTARSLGYAPRSSPRTPYGLRGDRVASRRAPTLS